MILWLATALLIRSTTSHAGWVSSCFDRFHLLGKSAPTSAMDPSQTQAEAWARQSSATGLPAPSFRQKSLIVGPGRKISDAKVEALTVEFEESMRKAQELGKAGLSAPKALQQFATAIDEHLLAASGILESNGVSHVIRPRKGALPDGPHYEILMERVGDSSMNHLASGLQRLHAQTELVYDPANLFEKGTLGSYSRGREGFTDSPPRLRTSAKSILGGIRKSVTLRHELQHAYYHQRQLDGRLGWMHGRFRSAKKQGLLSPFGEGAYADYMSFEEIANHEQDLRVLLHQLVRSPQDADLIQATWYKLKMTAQVTNRMNEVNVFLEKALASMPDRSGAPMTDWTVAIHGQTFQVHLSDSAEGSVRRLQFQFRELVVDKPHPPRFQLVSFGFDSEILLPASDPAPGNWRSLLEARLQKIREAGARAQTFVRSVKRTAFPDGLDTDPGTHHLEADTVARIEALLKTRASRAE